jgi:hypothetical protein
MPDDSWWILMLFVHEIAGIAAISCKYLPRHGALLCNRHHTLQRLVLEINNKVGIGGILTEAQRGAIDEATHQLSDSGDYAVAFANVSGCMEDLGMFVKYRLSAMDSGHRESLLRLSASAILELVDGITAVVAERTEDNEAYIDAAPDVLPHQLVRILPRDFCVYLQRHKERLDYTSATRSLRLLGASTRLCTTRTTANPM